MDGRARAGLYRPDPRTAHGRILFGKPRRTAGGFGTEPFGCRRAHRFLSPHCEPYRRIANCRCPRTAPVYRLLCHPGGALDEHPSRPGHAFLPARRPARTEPAFASRTARTCRGTEDRAHDRKHPPRLQLRRRTRSAARCSARPWPASGHRSRQSEG